MSQEMLAQPEFTKSYISAIERSKARPSLKALALLAGRLDLPMTTLLAAPVPEVEEPDTKALEEDFAYQMDHAQVMLNQQQGESALQLLNAAEAEYHPYLVDFRPATRVRYYRLRGYAYLRVSEAGSARQDLEQALALAGQLDDPQEVEQLRNALGAAFYAQDLPDQALEYHRQGVEAIHNEVVKDLNLKLSIYGNLANDYWALNDVTRPISAYHEALDLLQDVNNLAHQAGIYWGLSVAYKTTGNLDRAKMYAGQALAIYEAANNRTSLAQMAVNLGQILTERGEHEDAEKQFARALTLLAETDDPVMLSMVYEHQALLDLARGRLVDAQAHATHSRELIAAVVKGQDNAPSGDPQAKANATRAYARALAVSGQVAEQRGNTKEVDKLFKQALAALADTQYAETVSEIEVRYADLLSARGQHAEASQHYRAAVRYQGRSRR